MAGFRNGRGRGTRNAQQHGHPRQSPPQGPPPGPYGPGRGPGGPASSSGPGPQTWPQGAGHGGHGEPEYIGDPHGGGAYGGAPSGRGGYGGPPDPYANNPGNTQSFSIHDPAPYPAGNGYGDGYADPYSDGSTYQAGHAPPVGPRLHWKELLRGMILRPNATFWQMRDYPIWGPALTVTFVYGLLAVFGLDQARESVLNATLPLALQYIAVTGVAVVIMGLMLGAVTHTLARQFGGNGIWAPTIGLSMLIMAVTDAPRLLFAMFLGGTATLVQVIGWITWVAAAALFTSMVSRSHDLPWPRALGVSTIQLLALLALIKLGTF